MDMDMDMVHGCVHARTPPRSPMASGTHSESDYPRTASLACTPRRVVSSDTRFNARCARARWAS
ncbi:hypothetical protein C2E23DRAFT_281654 [Lenzites betulinus]|nr:hypothetical protein C2E23DRAFT_281654 [Lenzites betulinus]